LSPLQLVRAWPTTCNEECTSTVNSGRIYLSSGMFLAHRRMILIEETAIEATTLARRTVELAEDKLASDIVMLNLHN
jgi:hypothetical protein